MRKELKRRINKMMNELQAMKELIDSDALQEKQKEQEQQEVDLATDIHNQIMLLHTAPNYMELDRFARHFYELGLKARKEQKPVEIHIDNPNIQKIDPNMKISTSDSSADGKELLYVSNKSYKIGYRDGVNSVKKPAEWSEEDEKIYAFIYDFFENCWWSTAWDISREQALKMLKSLRPVKQEWSEEDEEMLEYIIGDVNDATQLYTTRAGKDMANKEIAWLKSLRPSWKPSEDEERLINTSISFLKDFADKGYENAVECIDWLKSKLNGNTCK